MFAEYTLGGKVCALFRLAKNSRIFSGSSYYAKKYGLGVYPNHNPRTIWILSMLSVIWWKNSRLPCMQPNLMILLVSSSDFATNSVKILRENQNTEPTRKKSLTGFIFFHCTPEGNGAAPFTPTLRSQY